MESHHSIMDHAHELRQSTSNRTTKPLVLIADDNANNRKYISAILRDQFRVYEATDGDDALQLVHGDETPELILLDLMMPRVDGRDVLRHLHGDPLTRNIPVIVITADGSESAEEQCLELGADDFLCRPFRRVSLILRANNLIQRQRLQRDLATGKLTEMQLREAKEAAVAENRAKSAFLANMSHEIRTPMNGIIGMANILRREGVTPKQADRLNTIDASARHLLSVINDILDISKIEAGKLVLEEAPIAVGKLLANVSSILSEQAKAKGLRLQIETGSLPPTLEGDPTRLQQALLNYAANAVKFTEAGTVTLRALMEEDSAGSVLLRFEVQDTGIGVAAEAMSRIFDAFEQADNSMTRKYGGTGLGLAITRRLAVLMGGQAGAESAPGAGSTFWFTARLKKSGEALASQSPTDVDAGAVIQQRHAGKRVLVVDDEPINREVAQIQLEAVGLIVEVAKDGADAVTLAQEKVYAAIFMDMQMPRLNGLEATRQIRRIPAYRHTPIIAMTANAFAEDKARCLESGMSDFLIKPFHPDGLYATLLLWLSQRDVCSVEAPA